MKLKFTLLIAAIVVIAPITTRAQPEPTHERFGVEKPVRDISKIQIKNFQDESLGSISDLGIDLINGRIVEVLVAVDSSLGVSGKIVAVPPHAFYPDPLNDVYRLDMSTDEFRDAPAIDLSIWSDTHQRDRVAAAYQYFAQEPYFLQGGETPSKTAKWPKANIGYVERSSKILDMPVGNFQNQNFGNVYSLSLDIPKGRIRDVVVLAPGNFKTKSVIPAMALSFNPARDGLLLDDSKLEYADEPRYVLTAPEFGNEAYSEEESYEGPHTAIALEQGRDYLDVDRTVRINRGIRAAKIGNRNVQVGTINGRVTLRGWVATGGDKRLIGEIAIAASRLELVDNQITVGKPVTAN
jgi:sporulation protein YlmC with PRC-barrel domain